MDLVDGVVKLIAEAQRKPPPRNPTIHIDSEALIKKFIKDNPDSVIAKYAGLIGDYTFLAQSGAKLEFTQKQLVAVAKSLFVPLKASVVSYILEITDPEEKVRGKTLSSDIGPELTQALQQNLSEQYSNVATKLPLTITLKADGATISLASLVPPPTQSFDF